jgi:hypothetical protein
LHRRREVHGDLATFERFLDERGYDILNRLLRDEPLDAADRPYRLILLGLYLREGWGWRDGEAPDGRLIGLDFDRLQGGPSDAVAYRREVEQAGLAALRHGYLQQSLDAEQVDAIRLYRLGEAARAVDEAFLPSQLGLHPRLGDNPPHGDWVSGRIISEANHGQPYFDVRLPTYEAVVARLDYADAMDRPYHWTYPLRPEGVLEFLRPLTWYQPFQTDDGLARVRLRPERLEPAPDQPDHTSVRLSDHVGDRPVLLFINDPVDGPLTEMFPAFEVLHRAYADRVTMYFVAVNIHDWYYSGMDDYLTGPGPNGSQVIHAWSEAERARKLRNRYIESPHATIPGLIDSDGQVVKTLYGAGGGSSHFVIIDVDGRIAEWVSNQTGDLDAVELAIRRTLDHGGRMAPDARHQRHYQRTIAPGLEPARDRVRLPPAVVTEVDRQLGVITVTAQTAQGPLHYEVHLGEATRLADGAQSATLDDVEPGRTVHVETFLDAMTHADELPRPDYSRLHAATLELPGRTLTLEPLGNYGRMRRVWYVMQDTAPAPMVARSVQLVDGEPGRADRAWSGPQDMWVTGVIDAVDREAGTMSLRLHPLAVEDSPGLRAVREVRAGGGQVHLDAGVARRLAVAQRWAAGETPVMRFVLDDAVDVVINGRGVADAGGVRVGDTAAVQWDVQQQGDGGALLPMTLRVSR